ncbi:formate dehydrogenase accessory sulfurtransferase FdhD [Pendulispora albinea]|uniref:Sulfur carrier protein FdhD n=1 Tax=Pendulispora albinea TaxID=2741071 RepID=A0ABZ2M7D1_9BACT
MTVHRQMMNLGIRSIEARRIVGRAPPESAHDDVAVEEPLEIRIAGERLAVTMRTPGHDRELVLGFLFAEGVIGSTKDVLGVVHCGRVGDEARENTIDVTLVPGMKPPIDPETGLLTRRGTLMTSACGVCGRRSIDDLVARVAPLAHTNPGIARSVLTGAVRSLRDRQPIFGRTGGCHAVSLVDFDGREIATYEDIGRHNAVDKVVGSRLLADALPGAGMVLVVSGRSSFEIVQKAFSAGVPIVAAVSAPSSLAIDLAKRANITLAGFVRDETMTVYTSPERIT